MLAAKLMQHMAKGIKGILVGPTQITTSSASTATAYSNQRKIDRTSNGVLWAVYFEYLSDTALSGSKGWHTRLRYSTDDGATWTDGGYLTQSGPANDYTGNGSLFIDVDDYAHLVYKDGDDGYIYYRRGTPNAGRTAWTWSAATQLSTDTLRDYPDVIAHREGTGWVVHVVTTIGNDGRTQYYPLTITSAGAVTVGSAVILGSGYSGSAASFPSIDFNHTGDGKTVAGGTPHLYVAWSAGATGPGKGIRFKKATYSGGSWTWGTEREIDSTRYVNTTLRWLTCMFDGTRVLIGGLVSTGSQDDVVLHERDAADTATTSRTLVSAATTNTYLFTGSASYDSAGNVYLLGRAHNGVDFVIDALKWQRATSTTVRSTAATIAGSSPYVSAKRGYSNNRIEWVHTDGTTSPYSIKYGGIK